MEKSELVLPVFLRPWCKADAPLHAEAVRETASQVKWLSWFDADYPQADSLKWFSMSGMAMTRGLAHDMGIFASGDGRLLGGIAINGIEKHNNAANLGYWIRLSEQGKGFATAAAQQMVQYGFEDVGLTRLQLVVAEENWSSRRVAEKVGAYLECMARNRVVIDGIPSLGAVYSLIPSDLLKSRDG